MLRIYLYVPLTQFTQFISVNNEVLKNCKALPYFTVCGFVRDTKSAANTEMNFKLKCEKNFSPINKIDLLGNEFENRSRIVCPSSKLSIPEENSYLKKFHSMIDSVGRGYRFGFSKPATPHSLGRW
ncbi:hypothetical protein T01_5938 [Trichinella spiralis]|uniref:Uncharacterized protein n=1 Tax=Trichinella spiralis TaxID=6334 RepID=A0A0V1AXE9_TRISP|nr:hypothetical protein T01_5938 [Trichinella spiralis]